MKLNLTACFGVDSEPLAAAPLSPRPLKCWNEAELVQLTDHKPHEAPCEARSVQALLGCGVQLDSKSKSTTRYDKRGQGSCAQTQ